MITFTFLNIPVRIRPTFWIFLLFFTNIAQDPSIASVIVGLVMMLSLLVHEYGHALTAAYFGAVPAVTLEAFGGYASYNPIGMTRKQQFFITLNGPLLESILIPVSYYLLHSGVFAASPYIQYTLHLMMRLNILWVLFNLIPVAPLDGSKLLYYFLEKICGDRAEKIAHVISTISICAITPYLFFEGYYFFAIYLLIMGYQNSKQVSLPSRISGETSSFKTYMSGIEASNLQNYNQAKQIFQTLIKSNDSYIRNGAKEALAKIYFHQNEKSKAYDLLLSANHDTLQEGKVILCQLAYEKCNYELATKYAHAIYAIKPSFEIALLNSKAFAQLNKPELAGGWLFTASKFGPEYEPQVKETIFHPVYDSLRDHDSFKASCSLSY